MKKLNFIWLKNIFVEIFWRGLIGWLLGGVVRMDDRECFILRWSRSLFIWDFVDVVMVCDCLY